MNATQFFINATQCDAVENKYKKLYKAYKFEYFIIKCDNATQLTRVILHLVNCLSAFCKQKADLSNVFLLFSTLRVEIKAF